MPATAMLCAGTAPLADDRFRRSGKHRGTSARRQGARPGRAGMFTRPTIAFAQSRACRSRVPHDRFSRPAGARRAIALATIRSPGASRTAGATDDRFRRSGWRLLAGSCATASDEGRIRGRDRIAVVFARPSASATRSGAKYAGPNGVTNVRWSIGICDANALSAQRRARASLVTVLPPGTKPRWPCSNACSRGPAG